MRFEEYMFSVYTSIYETSFVFMVKFAGVCIPLNLLFI